MSLFPLCSLLGIFIAPGASPAAPLPVHAIPGFGGASLGSLVGGAGGMEVRAPSQNTVRWAEPFHRKADGAGAQVSGPLTLIQTHYEDPLNGNVVLILWDETAPAAGGVDILVDGETIATFTDSEGAAFITSLEAGTHVFRVEDALPSDPAFAEGSLEVVTSQPFDDVRDFRCESGGPSTDGTCKAILRWALPATWPSHYLILADGSAVEEAADPASTSWTVDKVAAGGHGFTIIGFLRARPESSRALYRGGILETFCTITCAGAICVPPGLRVCQAGHGGGPGENAIRAQWTPGRDRYPGGIDVFVDGAPVGHLDDIKGGTRVTFLGGLTGGAHMVALEGICEDGVRSERVESSIDLLPGSPLAVPVTGTVSCEFDPTARATTVAWRNAYPAQLIDVYVHSPDFPLPVLAGTIPGGSQSVRVTETSAADEISLQFFADFGGDCQGSVLVSCGEEKRFLRGLCDGQSAFPTISSAVFALSYLFLGATTPGCLEACDADRSGDFNVTDPVYVLNFLFKGGPPPAGWIDPSTPECETASTPNCVTGHEEACR